jgi:hypothetical protein
MKTRIVISISSYFPAARRSFLTTATSIVLAAGANAQAPPPCLPPPPNMVSWWAGDGNADDIVGGNNGTLQGGATFAAGEVAQAFSFNGVNDFVRIPASSSLQPATITLDAWIKPQVFANYQKIISKDFRGDGSWNYPYASYILDLTNNAPAAHITINGALTDCISPEAVPMGSFTHVAATYDGTALRIYQNGILKNTTSAVGTITYGNLTDLALGTRSPYTPDEGVTGLIDEIEIFNRALSASEIQAIFAAGSAGVCKPTPTPTPTPACAAQVQPPINADGSSVFNVRRGVIPVKFTLSCNGIPTCDLSPATIAVTRTAGGVIGQINESVYTGPSDSGSNFRIEGCQYHYNLTSNTLGVGTYRVDILINNQVIGSATFQLK